MLRSNGYEQLLGSNSNNEFKLSVSAVNTNGCANKGTLKLCVGSSKNFNKNAQEFKVGSKPEAKEYNFSYNNAHRSSNVIALYNRKSFWAEDQQIGKAEIPLDNFDPNSPCTREIQLGENGPKVVLHATRNENF
ncbi:hypothetical protein TVAG_263890 [Trichomonas vaginalis G3]|uniref:Uncharacterized protein n=1 Tax=Trichomonas vaginalis (strain ATCC PRA-98 / G3) TaxID=412133 RepID=A2EP15_TRIV3|nr:hypothetical protein TVAGG3_0945660 [Trichomonas vaginalis G3]EAY05619.1 hypothetical protein TVAG_263890 [Trichomonas vaginalis G3]KAI5486859.1 hypothetical protein TVAGG3_0945660 [Trichomonas vaginalis G3]|eukprot:XP_001317842.1 hypothetical protein [Trichomonas vaginalis G3]